MKAHDTDGKSRRTGRRTHGACVLLGGAMVLLTALAPIGARADDYSQGFESGWTIGNSYITETNANWVTYDAAVRTPGLGWPAVPFGSFCCWLNGTVSDPGLPGNPLVRTPLLSNGAGILSFYAATRYSDRTHTLTISKSSNGSSWTPVGTVAVTNSGSFSAYSLTVNDYNPIYLRIEATSSGQTSLDITGLDAISISLPPSYIAISDVARNPPEPVVLSNTVVSATVERFYGATNIDAKVFYSTNNGLTYAQVSMTKGVGDTYTTDFPHIPAQFTPGLPVGYYLQVTYTGQTPGTFTNLWPSGAPGVREAFQIDWRDEDVFTNTTYDGWTLVNGLEYQGYGWLNVLGQGSGTPALSSPSAYPNGVGTVFVEARNNLYADAITYDIQISSDGATWTNTVGTFTNTSTAFATKSVIVNSYTPSYVRLVKTGDNSSNYHHLVVADISVTEPSSFVSFSAPVLDPPAPLAGGGADVEIDITPGAGANNVGARLYYSTTSSNRPFSAYIDLEPAEDDTYRTVEPIALPANAGSTVWYYIEATFQGINPLSPATDPVTGTHSFLVGAVPPSSPYPNMLITGSQSTNMLLATNSYWRGVIVPSGTLNTPVFQFASGASTWGDADAPMNVTPVYGAADAGYTIGINESISSPLIFTFSDDPSNGLAYTVAEGAYVNADTWTGASSTFGVHQNGDGWRLDGGRVSSTDPAETNKAFVGPYLLLKYDTGAGELRSPEMAGGIGSVSFWYRNWHDDGATPATLYVDTATRLIGADWTNIAVFANAASPDWQFLRQAIADPDARYVRLRIEQDTQDSWLCLDEVAVTEVGASVGFTNSQHSPPSPQLGDAITVSVQLLPAGGASNLAGTVYYRAGTQGVFSALAGTVNANVLSATLQPPPFGTVQYYFNATYDGFDPAPRTWPAGGADAPLSVSVSPTLPDSRFQTFSNGWTIATTLNFISETNANWVAHDALVRGSGIGWPSSYPSPSYGGWLNAILSGGADAGQPGNPYLRSPFISNGVGSVSFQVRSKLAGDQVYELQWSPDGASIWLTLQTFTNGNNTAWTTNAVYVNSYDDMYLRIIKVTDFATEAQYLGLDDIRITHPPSDLTVTNVVFSPVYPAQNQDVTVYADIQQLNQAYPAFGYDCKVIYRLQGGAWQSNAMSLVSGSTYAGTIPSAEPGIMEFYVRCDFEGVYYQSGSYTENRSPAFAPETEHTQAQPDSFYSYNVRYYRSDYQSVSITGNFNSVYSDMIGNDIWEGVFYTSPTNSLNIGLVGVGYAENSAQSPGSTAWGDNDPWKSDLPAIGSVETGGSNIVLNGTFDGQYLVRLDLRTGEYIVLRTDWQDFDTWNIHPTLFSEGSQGRNPQSWRQEFTTWPLSTDSTLSAQFDALTWNEPSPGLWGGEGWLLDYGTLVNTTNGNRRCELTAATSSRLYPGPSALPAVPGSGTLSFSYRATDTNTHPTVYANGYGWGNINLTTSIAPGGDNSDDGSYQAVLYRYSNATNYYECRLVATNSTQLFFEFWKRQGSSHTKLFTSGTFAGTLSQGGAVKVYCATSGSNVRSIFYYNNVARLDRTDVSGLLGPGTFGYAAYDCNMLVDAISDSVNGYSESFGEPSASGWTTGAGWELGSGKYRREGRYNAPQINLTVATATDGQAPLQLLTFEQTFTNVVNLDYQSAVVNVRNPSTLYTILVPSLPGGRVRVDNVQLTSWRGKDQTNDTWTIGDGWVSTEEPYGGSGRALELRSSRAYTTTNYQQFVRTPVLNTAGALSFVYRTPTGPATLALRWASDTDPNTYSTVTNLTLPASSEWSATAYPVNVQSNGFLQLAHVSTGDDVRLFMDNVTVFDYHESSTDSWIAVNALVTDQQPDKLFLAEGQSGYLNHDDDTDTLYGRVFEEEAHIQSPYLTEGVGEISFWYRRWPVSGGLDEGRLRIEMSPDGETWQTAATLRFENTVYRRHVLDFYDVQNHYVRFTCPTNDGVPDRVCLDNIRIAAPIATSLVVSNAYIVPGDPAVYTNAVRVRAELTEYILDPTNVQVRAYYHIGTNQWATWSEDLDDSLGMTLIATDTNASPPVYLYETANAIPGLTPDTVVQYLVRADFGGRLHADKTSPQRFKDAFENPAAYEPLDLNETYGGGTNRTPYFIVLENPLGSVWINEINIEDWNEYYEVRGDREYVELCGPAGTSLQDWTIRFLTPVTPYPNLVTNDTYTIWNRPTLGNDTNGFGFWVLGDATNTIPYDQSFTNAADPYYGFNLPYPEGCIQLIRPIGLVEHAVSYGTSSGYFAAQYATNSGFHFAGIDNFWQDSSLGLTNTGSAYADFDWYDYAGSYTPGAINAGQELVQNNEIPTELWIDATWIDSGSVYIAFTATRDITPTAWYSTNLLQTNWWQISPAPYTGSGGSYTQWFSVMTNAPSYFYRIKGEDGL